MSYSYDVASQLLGVTYQVGTTVLGNLTYTYDLAGNRTTVGGSYAQTGLPSALPSASFNADNQLTQFGSSNLTYDANGNLTGDATNTYTWDARNHLVSISGAVSASFQYDPFGRRVSKTIGTAVTNYLYDGVNPVQELAGGAPKANLLTGLNVDEYFQRTDANGPANFLTDALGSTIALSGPGGNTLAQYTYGPYGKTTMTGSSSNPYQYTGRENDGTGLYYYRGRYYNPTFQRFISEDPIGIAGGIDVYAYVGDDPFDFSDPFGLDKGRPRVCGPFIAAYPKCAAARRTPFGNGQCVALVKAVCANIPQQTRRWIRGDQVLGNYNILPGTAIATFGPDGTYQSIPGESHAALYLSQSDKGIRVVDQWSGQVPETRTIGSTNPDATVVNQASAYYVILGR
jgi:RHS repeat-associated protein